jgi:Mannosyl oligosaccharide glucosidase.
MDKLGPSHQFTWNSQGRRIDLSSQRAFDARSLSAMAKLINLEEESESYRKKHNKLAEIINDLGWNEEHQFYFDLGYGEQNIRYHIGSYGTELAGIVPKSRQEGWVPHLPETKK